MESISTTGQAPNENREETFKDKALRVQQVMLGYLKKQGWTQRHVGIYVRARPKKLVNGKQMDDGQDVVNFNLRPENPGSHYLGRVYIARDGGTEENPEEFDDAMLVYLKKAREEAEKAGIADKIPIPGQGPTKEAPKPKESAIAPAAQREAPREVKELAGPKESAVQEGKAVGQGLSPSEGATAHTRVTVPADAVPACVIIVIKENGQLRVTSLKPGETFEV